MQVVHGFPPENIGGTEVYAYNLSMELSKRHKVFIFHRNNNLNIEEYAVTHKRIDNLETFAVNNTFRECNSFEMTYKNEAIVEKFTQVLDEVKPDIVHIQHLLYLSAKIIGEIKKRKLPIVFTLHDYWLFCPQGQLLKNQADLCSADNISECINCISSHLHIRKNTFNSYIFLKKYIPNFAIQFLREMYLDFLKFNPPSRNKALNNVKERFVYMQNLCSCIDLFTSPSKSLKEKISRLCIPEEKMVISKYGLNLGYFKNHSKRESQKLRFGFIGSILPAKGVHILIRAFNKVADNCAELKIYGSASSYKAIFGNYLSSVKGIAKNKNIKFMGEFQNRDISSILSEIDVLIAPSIWHENSPLVIQEALAAKTPVIASNIGGIPELVEHNANGFLCKPNDVNELYIKMSSIIKNPSLLEAIKINIQPPKKIEINAEEMESIYNTLLNKC